MTGRVTPSLRQSQFVALNDAVIVERDVLRVAEKIMRHSPNLKVKYLDPDRAAGLFDAPYIITEMCRDGQERVLMSVWQLDDSVYDRVVMGDLSLMRSPEDLLEKIDKNNEAVRQAEKQKQREKNEAIMEMVADVIASPKDTYSATNPVTGREHVFTEVPQEKKVKKSVIFGH